MTQEELIREVGKVIPSGVYSEEVIQLAFTMFTHGYNYAVEKGCEWLRQNMGYWLDDCDLAEDELEDNQALYSAMLEALRKVMQ